MSGDYGIKIKNIEASTLIEYNNGLRDHYECKNAILTNSLFLDYLKKIGLDIYNECETRDVVCFEFNYGTRSYKSEMEHLHKIAVNAIKEYKIAYLSGDEYLIKRANNKREKINSLAELAYNNRDNYAEMSTEECRIKLYEEGISITYQNYKKPPETIHYKMLFRSTGKAKKGSVNFIRDELYEEAKEFLYMGIKLPEKNAMIVEASAYTPLISSGIVGKVRINPDNILVLEDVTRHYSRNAVSIELNEDKHCIAKWIDDYDMTNELFDGQALIDSSIFPEWASGYVLLRNHFTKMAAFNSNIQDFFKDWCNENNEDYETYQVKDCFGNYHYAKDIELITTTNATKFIKFNISYEYWCEWVRKNDNYFGVVKYSHPSKLGQFQKMSYQYTNSLDEDTIANVCQETVKYIEQMKNDEEVFKSFLRKNMNFSNDYEVLLDLCEWNPDFVRSSYFRDRKKIIISQYLYKAKTGEIIQNGDNLVIVGSPYAMLLYAITGDESVCDLDDTLFKEDGAIQCYTPRFEGDEYLAGFRSPFNGRFNMNYLHNHYDVRFDKYFNFSKQIIAVNMIGTDFQPRNNGSDQDSDSLYVTNQIDIVNHAKRCYVEYPTIVNNIPKDSRKYDNTPRDFALMDSNLSSSQRDIGESSNLAQICQSYRYTFEDKKYDDYVAILSTVAQASIDSSKRRFDINIPEEIAIIRKDMDINTHGYPRFWKVIRKDISLDKINNDIHCPMNYLQDIEIKKPSTKKNYVIPFGNFIVKEPLVDSRKKSRKVEELIEKYSLSLYNESVGEYLESGDYEWNNWLLMRSDFEALIEDIRKIGLSTNYKSMVIRLIKRAFVTEPEMLCNKKKLKAKTDKNKPLLMKVLYDVNPDLFLSCFKREI